MCREQPSAWHWCCNPCVTRRYRLNQPCISVRKGVFKGGMGTVV